MSGLESGPYLGYEQNKAWGYASLEYAEEESDCYRTCKIGSCSETCDSDTPSYDAKSRVFSQRKPLKQASGWEFETKVAWEDGEISTLRLKQALLEHTKVKYASQP